jgi:hypothetical protein
MKIISLTIMCLITACSFSQTSVSQDTVRNQNDEISISFTISGELDSISEISIQQFDIVNSDTISIFLGVYNLNADDPSNFRTFSINDALGELNFGIGEFEYGLFYAKIIVSKLVGLPEEFIIN